MTYKNKRVKLRVDDNVRYISFTAIKYILKMIDNRKLYLVVGHKDQTIDYFVRPTDIVGIVTDINLVDESISVDFSDDSPFLSAKIEAIPVILTQSHFLYGHLIDRLIGFEVTISTQDKE